MNQRCRQADLEHRDDNQNRHVFAARHGKPPLQGQKQEQAKGSYKHPRRRKPQRRDVLETQFHDGPIHPPKEDDQGQEYIGPPEGFRLQTIVNSGLCPSTYL